MNTEEHIQNYIASQPASKRSDMEDLHARILRIMPDAKLWFLDGKNSENKTVSNPNIGYGSLVMKYADGSAKPFYQIGMSANTSGISIYIIGLEDKMFLARTYGETLGKASISGYCIKFKKVSDINTDVLEAAIQYGFTATKES